MGLQRACMTRKRYSFNMSGIEAHEIPVTYCANLTCEQACCSYDYQREKGIIVDDHCCTRDEYESHKEFEKGGYEIPLHDNSFVTHDPNQHLVHYNDPSIFHPPKHESDHLHPPSDSDTPQETILVGSGWNHVDTIASLLAAFALVAILLVSAYYAVRWRKKYLRLKRVNNVAVRHTVNGDVITVESASDTPLTSSLRTTHGPLPSSYSSEKQPIPNDDPETPSRSTPPAYHDLFSERKGSSTDNEASTSANTK